jgi:hypothetical protein
MAKPALLLCDKCQRPRKALIDRGTPEYPYRTAAPACTGMSGGRTPERCMAKAGEAISERRGVVRMSRRPLPSMHVPGVRRMPGP